MVIGEFLAFQHKADKVSAQSDTSSVLRMEIDKIVEWLDQAHSCRVRQNNGFPTWFHRGPCLHLRTCE